MWEISLFDTTRSWQDEGKMLATMTQNKVLALLEQSGAVRTKELADALGVVPETIRRDLEELEQSGLLRRIHGGAVIPSGGAIETPVFIRESTNRQVKDELCRAAVGELVLQLARPTARHPGLRPPKENRKTLQRNVRLPPATQRATICHGRPVAQKNRRQQAQPAPLADKHLRTA